MWDIIWWDDYLLLGETELTRWILSSREMVSSIKWDGHVTWWEVRWTIVIRWEKHFPVMRRLLFVRSLLSSGEMDPNHQVRYCLCEITCHKISIGTSRLYHLMRWCLNWWDGRLTWDERWDSEVRWTSLNETVAPIQMTYEWWNHRLLHITWSHLSPCEIGSDIIEGSTYLCLKKYFSYPMARYLWTFLPNRYHSLTT